MFSDPLEHTNWFSRLIRTGVAHDMSYRQRRQIIVTNIAGLIGGFCATVFLVSNYMTSYYDLCWLDVVTGAACLSMPLFQRKGMTLYPSAGAILTCSLCCAYSAYAYHNHTEYFLLLFMGVSFAIWDNLLLTFALATLNALLFLALQFNPYPAAVTAVPGWNKGVVLVMVLVLYLYFLYYFKRQNANYQRLIEDQNQQLRQLNLNKEKVMSVIAHDIRGPIAGVYSSLELLKDGHLEREEFDGLTGQLLSQVGNLQINIVELLEWSKSQISDLKPRKGIFLVRDILPQLLGMLRFQLDAKQVKIDTSQLQDTPVYADKAQTEVILRNLISNAVKFSYRGATVMLGCAQEEQDAVLFVQDTGQGISRENLKKIFDPAELFSTFGTDNEKGNGLGLKLCREFALQNDGDLSINSKPGEGSTCILRLPAPRGT